MHTKKLTSLFILSLISISPVYGLKQETTKDKITRIAAGIGWTTTALVSTAATVFNAYCAINFADHAINQQIPDPDDIIASIVITEMSTFLGVVSAYCGYKSAQKARACLFERQKVQENREKSSIMAVA